MPSLKISGWLRLEMTTLSELEGTVFFGITKVMGGGSTLGRLRTADLVFYRAFVYLAGCSGQMYTFIKL